MNNNNAYRTGWGANPEEEWDVAYNAGSLINLWTGDNGQKASTTGNITGVYDTAGGSFDRISAYNNNGSSSSLVDGSSFASAGGTSNKYSTAYRNTTSAIDAPTFQEFWTNSKDVSHVGDAMHEVWTEYGNTWHGAYLFFVGSDSSSLFFGRGGKYDDETNMFYAGGHNNGASYISYGYRVCLTPTP